MPTTSRLVEVPMVVAMPPISVARPTGISTRDGGRRLRKAEATSTGNSITTIGVLFKKALKTAASSKVSNIANWGALPQ